MPDLLIRQVDPALHARLKARAAAHHRSLADEARALLLVAIAREDVAPKEHLVELADRLFGRAHGVDLPIPDRRRDDDWTPPDLAGRDFTEPDVVE